MKASGKTRPLDRWLTLGLLMIVFLPVCVASPDQQRFYRWTDEQGRVHFSDQAPQQGKVEQIQVRPQIYSRQPRSSDTGKPVKSPLQQSRQRTPKVVMYSADWCGICKQARNYFNSKRIAFTEYDIDHSALGRRTYQQLKGTGVPIILVGELRMNGFTPAGFESLLHRARGNKSK